MIASPSRNGMLDVLDVAPTLVIAVLQPNESSSNIRRAMFDVVNDDRLFAPATRRTI
jgi:hypothetical protein